jgi:hypothetical protein
MALESLVERGIALHAPPGAPQRLADRPVQRRVEGHHLLDAGVAPLLDVERQHRYRRLGEARAAARAAGYRGAMYPWQSGSDGKEETQVVHLNPLSGADGGRADRGRGVRDGGRLVLEETPDCS